MSKHLFRAAKEVVSQGSPFVPGVGNKVMICQFCHQPSNKPHVDNCPWKNLEKSVSQHSGTEFGDYK